MKLKPSRLQVSRVTPPCVPTVRCLKSRTPLGKTSGLIGETTAVDVGLKRSDMQKSESTECKSRRRIFTSPSVPNPCFWKKIHFPSSTKKEEKEKKRRCFKSHPLTWNSNFFLQVGVQSVKLNGCRANWKRGTLILLEEKEERKKGGGGGYRL